MGANDSRADDTWRAVDAYLERALVPPSDDLEWVLEASTAAGLPAINVSPLQGRFLQILALAVGAEHILEIGTLGGYSTLWLARALPDSGRLVSLEVDPERADVARANLERAGLASRTEVRVGAALDSLELLAAEQDGPFDLTFIDADKAHNADYFDWAVRLSRPGALIVVDNVIRDGAVLDDSGADPSVAGTRRLHEAVGRDPRVTATAIQTVGSKGYDGFLVARVRNS